MTHSKSTDHVRNIYQIISMDEYKEENSSSKNSSQINEISVQDSNFLEFIKQKIVEIYSYLQEVELITNIEPLLLLLEYAKYDNPEVTKLLNTNDYLPLFMDHIMKTTDPNILAPLLECFCTFSLQFPQYKQNDYFQPLLEMFFSITEQESIDTEVLLQLITAITIYLTNEAISIIPQNFYERLINFIPQQKILLYAITLFVYCYVEIVDTLEKDQPSCALIFLVMKVNEQSEFTIQAAKVLKIMIKKKFMSLKVPEFLSIVFDFLRVRNSEVSQIVFKALSYLDEEELSVLNCDDFINIIIEILELEDPDHVFDKMKGSAYLTLQRIAQIYPFIFQQMFLGEESPFIGILLENVSNNSIAIRKDAGLLLARLIKAFPQVFTNHIIEQDELLIDAVVSVLQLETDISIILIEGLEAIAKQNEDALFAMGEVGIIDAIEDMIPSFNEDIAEVSQAFIDYAHEVFDK